MSTLIRDVAPVDTVAIQALYAEEARATFSNYEYVAPDTNEMQRRIDAVVAVGYPWLVAERDGLFAGYAYASAFRSRAGYRWTVENTVYVHPSHQRRGIGRALMDALIQRCTTLGFRQMIAVIGDAGNAASVELHRALGFEVVGVFRGIGYKAVANGPGRWLDNLQMQRSLGPGDNGPPDS